MQGANNGKAGKGTDPFDFGNPLDLHKLLNYLRIIRERWLWGLSSGLLVAAVFAFMSLRQTPVYQASATLLIEAQAEQVIDVEQVVDTSLSGRGDAELDNHLRQMQSRTFLSSVVRSFDQRMQQQIVRAYLPESPDEPAPGIGVVLSENTSFSRDGQVFTVTTRHRDPEMAQLIANRFVAQYINNILTRTGVGNQAALTFLEEQAEALRAKIATAEKALTDYRRRLNLVSLEESQNIIVQRLTAINNQLTNTRMQQMSLSASLEQVADLQAQEGDLTEISVIAQYGAIPDILARKKAIEAEHAELDLRYLERHPRMIEVTNRLEQVGQQLNKEVERAVRDLENRKATVDRHMAHLETELAKAEENALRLDQQSIEYNVLRRQLESDRQTFEQIIDRLNETSLSARLNTTNLRILDEAVRPSFPVEPNPTRTAAVAILLFGLLFAGVPMAIEALDSRVKSGYDAEVFVGKPLLSDIPNIKGLRTGEVSANVVVEDSDEVVAESFRSAYSSLQMSSAVEYPKSILITSTRPSEGKSFISLNMAATMAKHGLRVLVMDCDFRRPTLHKLLELRNDHGTLRWFDAVAARQVDYRDLDLSKDSLLQVHEVAEGLHFLRSGGSTKRTTELIDSDAFDHLLKEVQRKYDVVLLDTPPISVFTDSLFLSERVDEVIYVCRYNLVSRHKVAHFVKRLDGATQKVAGIVINGRTSSKGMRYGYDYNYSYYSSDYKYYKSYADDPAAAKKSAKRRVVASSRSGQNGKVVEELGKPPADEAEKRV